MHFSVASISAHLFVPDQLCNVRREHPVLSHKSRHKEEQTYIAAFPPLPLSIFVLLTDLVMMGLSVSHLQEAVEYGIGGIGTIFIKQVIVLDTSL